MIPNIRRKELFQTIRNGGSRKTHNVKQDREVGYWSEKLGCTRAELIAAVKMVGPMIEDAKKELGN